MSSAAVVMVKIYTLFTDTMASTKRKASTELTNQPLQKKRCESKLQQEVEGTGPPNFKTELEETNNETASFSVQNPTTLSLNDKPEPEVDKSEAVPSAAKTEPTPTSLPARRKVKNRKCSIYFISPFSIVM